MNNEQIKKIKDIGKFYLESGEIMPKNCILIKNVKRIEDGISVIVECDGEIKKGYFKFKENE